MSATTVSELLARAAADPRAGLRLIDRRERATWRSWADVREGARRAAAGIRSLGVGHGERVALVYPTGEEFFGAFFGTLLAGAVPVPLYPPVRLGRLDEYHRRTAGLLRAAGARLVLADRGVRRLLGEAIAAARPPAGCRTLAELPAGSPDEAPGDAPAEPTASADDLALVQFSSGTTVEPKPVALSHRAVLAQTRLLNGFWPDRPGVRHTGVSWLPLYHDMGLIGCVFPALERPSVLTLIPPELFVARPAVWLRTLSRYRATVSPAPNFAYGLCVEKIEDEELEGVDLSSWEVALNGAEAVSPAVLRAFTERFARWGLRREALTPVYGLSEAALAVTFSDPDRPFVCRRFERGALGEGGTARADPGGVELVSVGRPLPGFEVEVRDGEGRALESGRSGRLWVRGPSLMEGYLDRPQATAEVLRDGWLDTGDLGFFHRGELFLTGRARDLVIVRGRNHAPEELEGAVDALPATRSGCAAAVSHLPEGADREQVLLFVERHRRVAAAPAEELAAACRAEVRGRTGIEVDRVIVLDPGTLPRTSSGKIRRPETLRRWLAGELDAPRPVTALGLGRALARSWRSFARAPAKATPSSEPES